MKLLIQSLVITLVGISLVGCKSSSNGNKVTSHRSNKPGANNNKTKDGGDIDKDKTKTQVPQQGQNPDQKDQGTDQKNQTDQTDGRIKTLRCDSPTPTGWESHVMTTTKSDQSEREGIQVHYLVPRNSSFKNPVLVLPHEQDPVSKELAEKVLKVADENDFDPIMVEVRGTGCSTALPQDKQKWNLFNAENAAADLEKIRKATIQDKKWKIWSLKNSSLIALKAVEMYPATISSLHMADFTLAATPLEQEKNKLEAQIEAWNKLKEFSAQNEFEITSEVEEKIKKTLLTDKTCKNEASICKLELVTSLLDYLSGDEAQWKEAVQILKALSEGEIPQELLRIAHRNQKNYLYEQLLIAAHVDNDPYLTACEKALNDSKLKDQADKTLVKSCSIDQAMKKAYLSQLRGQIQHKKMNFDLIQKNRKAQKIDLYLVVAEKSLLNPLTSVNDTIKMITGENELETLFTPASDKDLFFTDELLQTL